MFDFHKPLNKQQTIAAIAFIFLFCLFIISPVWTHGEPDKNLFIICWFIAFTFIAFNVLGLFVDSKNNNFSYKYADLKEQYGKPLATFRPHITHAGDLFLKGFKAKVDIYNELIIISFCGKAMIVNSKENLDIKRGIIGTTVIAYDGLKKIKLHLWKYQETKLKKYLIWYN